MACGSYVRATLEAQWLVAHIGWLTHRIWDDIVAGSSLVKAARSDLKFAPSVGLR